MKPIFTLCLLMVTSIAIAGNQPARLAASPVTFLRNENQWQQEILYEAENTSVHTFFLKGGISFAQSGPEIENPDGTETYPYIVWNMRFVSPDPECKVEAIDGKPSVVSYLSGNDPSKWVIRPMEYRELRYRSIYNNIDLHFYGSGQELKYDYVVHPGGSIQEIKAYYEGVRRLDINGRGELEITTDYSKQIQRRPVAWLDKNGVRTYVDIRYELINDTTFGFAAPEGYDQSCVLIIDPLFQMVWSSYTLATGGSNNINYCFANAMDRDGNVYLTGMVDSTFPITPGAYSGPGNVQPEIFVAKFSKDGTTLLYSTYLPGSSSEFGTAIAVDDLGRAYVTGVVDLNITGLTNFPSTPNAYQPVHNSGSDAFITVLNPTGTGLVYSSFLGGTGSETGYGIALGAPGTAYIVGKTSIGNFPVVNATAFPTGDVDVFVAKFDINQSGSASLVYSTRIGAGSFNYCYGRSIAVNSSGNAFITGHIFSSPGSPAFPLTSGAYNTVFNTGMDGTMSFVTKLSATTPVTLSYSTFLGPGSGNAVALDPNTDEAFVTGTTRTFTYPVTAGALQTVHGQDVLGNPNGDAFVSKLNAAGSALVYSTFLGGRYEEIGQGIAVNGAGEAYVTGIAQDSFPTSAGALQPENAGTYDFFVAHINAAGTAYSCGGATYVGGSDADYTGSFYDYPAPKVSLRDHFGSGDTICVSATSHSQDFPTTPGVYGPVKVNGIADQPVFFKMTCVPTGTPPLAGFTLTADTTCLELTIDFTDTSLNNPTSWQWSFPGAVPAVSVLQHPTGISYTSNGTYTIQLIACNALGCDTISSVVQVSLGQVIPLSIGNDTTICAGTAAILNGPAGMVNYTWQFNGAATGGNQPSLMANQAGQYTLAITDQNGCEGNDTVNISISDPVVSLGTDQSVCEGDSVLLNAGTGYFQYSWTLNGAVIPVTSNSFYTGSNGIYVVVVEDSVGCTAADTVQLNVNVLNVPLPPDTVLCDGASFVLEITGVYSGFQWFQGSGLIDTSNTVTINQAGTYTVVVSDSFGCTASDVMVVQTSAVPEASFTYEVMASCTGIQMITQNSSTNAVSYLWDFGDGTTSTTQDPIHSYSSLQGIMVQLVAFNGYCSDTALTGPLTADTVIAGSIPKVFSPNNDHLNDCFRVDVGSGFAECYQISIFNRWGGKVGESSDVDWCWEGTGQNGSELPSGVYFYIIRIGNIDYKGTVELIR